MPNTVSSLKLQATKAFGAHVVVTKNRAEAESLAAEAVQQGAVLIPPYDADTVICGQGTATLEALEDVDGKVDAIFAPIGGGGLLSGTFLAAQGGQQLLNYQQRDQSTSNEFITHIPAVFGAEPLAGNDATNTLRDQKESIVKLPDQPNTLADGAMTLAMSPRTHSYVNQTQGLYEITENEMKYWTQWLTHMFKFTIEPTSAMAMSAAVRALSGQAPVPGRADPLVDLSDSKTGSKTVVILVSGGNMSQLTHSKVWDRDYLETVPSLELDWDRL